MSALTDLKSQLAKAACFACLPVDNQQAIKTYLLAVLAKGSLDPKTLLSQSRGFNGVPSGMLPALQATLAATMAGSTVPALVAQNTCSTVCLTPVQSLWSQIYSLAPKAGGSTDPKTLARLAACFTCIPTNLQLSLQAFLMAVIAGVVTAPPAIPNPGIKPLPDPNLGLVIPPTVMRLMAKTFAYPVNTVHMILGDAIFIYQGGSGGGTVVCPVPTGLTTALQGNNSTVVSWDPLPPQATYTEIWTSSDNSTFTLADNVAAPATTITLPPQGPTTYLKIRFCSDTFVPVFPLTAAWMAQVVANGGATPSNNTRAFLTVFETATASINAKLHNVNVVAPDSLIAAKTPFIRKFGSALWTKIALGAPPAEDLTVAGIKAATDAANGNVYDLGFGPAAIPSFTSGNCGCFAYYTTVVASAFDGIGCYDGVSAIGVQNANGGNELYIGWNVGAILTVGASNLAGLYMTSRTATNVLSGYFGNAAGGFVLRGTNNTNNALAPNATPNVGACGELQAGPAAKPNPSRFSCFGICDGLTQAEGTILYNAVQAVRTGFGGGFA